MWNDTGKGTVMFSIAAKINLDDEQIPSVWTAMGLSDDTEMVKYLIFLAE